MTIDQSTTTTTTTTSTSDRPSDEATTAPVVSTPARATAPVAPKKGTTFESLAVAGLAFGVFAIVIAVFAVGMAARAVSVANSGGGGAGASTAPATLDLTETEFAIKPAKAEISSTGVITIANKGTMDHDLQIENVKSKMIAPGTKGELQIKGLAPGTYTMYCAVPGHRAAGMAGTIVVK